MTTCSLPSAAYMVAESVNRNNSAAQLFSAAFAAGRSHRMWAGLTRRPKTLRSLAADHGQGKSGHYAGRQLVAIDAIRGSEGRTDDFDDQFHPLNTRMHQRWESVANAIEDGVHLPPVELIQVGAEYYVRDGHHRISVAAALGRVEIEAVITQWNGD